MTLKPCPFCADPMEDRGYGAMHVEGGKCPLQDLAIDPVKWNNRAADAPADLLDALNEMVMASEGVGLDARARRKKALDRAISLLAKAERTLETAGQ